MCVTHLQKREIQAPLVSALIKGFIVEFGYEKAIKVVREVIKKDAVESGRELAERFSGNSIAELARIVKEVWATDDSMKIEIIKETETELFFDVTECGYARMYEKYGLRDLGVVLSCERDFVFQEGFNPAIELTRTQTIMQGNPICDFRYRRKG